ncbi:DUF1003 domain-containing protein [Leptospira levettii]|uniref:DUF1003 domain-containing protein n=1 Tax=Leptospira levettii TaxID=2023178 RepID=A0ABY2MQM8_9LEPT|nr:hypothetical protein CH381_28480 [Leptospira sp. mixed culture ATI2-C-A1]TGL73133.1 DUF1003 domain-containing protein [Leptospira levettii]TGM27899.1 DUF1003 domain-containing protein [Leptospira levettii]TGM36637.1 DUF1003 domain-containing protein [Leptospira levettii]TGM94252.1 DUF1003 domain-containing protein [Leptospira levettii]
MMSQNRQEVKDRIRSENDTKMNLKSEIEIRTLYENPSDSNRNSKRNSK